MAVGASLRAVLDDYPGFVPGMAVSIIGAVLASGPAARVLGIGRVHAVALLLALGGILSATLTPGEEALRRGVDGTGLCDTGRTWIAPLAELTSLGETSLNVALFVPLGLSIGAIGLARRRLWMPLLGAAIALPAAIELTQLVVVTLGRACQTADVVDNMLGVGVGFVAGVAVRHLAGSRPADAAVGNGGMS